MVLHVRVHGLGFTAFMKSSAANKHLFYAELAKLLEAGFGIREAAGVLSGTGPPAAQAGLLSDLQRGLEGGQSIAASLGGNKSAVSNFELGILHAGERGGRLPQAMRHLADYFGMLAAARRDLLKGLIHPVVILHLGIFIGTVPTAMMQGDRPVSEAVVVFFGTLIAVYIIAFALYLAGRAFLIKARTDPQADGILDRIPLLGKTRRHLSLAAYCKVYQTCLLAGLPMRETVSAAVDASQSGLVLDAGKRLQETLARGNPLGPVMMEERAFPKVFARSYATGEAAGTLDKDLERWAKHYHDESAANARTLSAAVPRFFYLCMLCYVGWRIVAFYNGYFDSMRELME
jgi:general secretion pathway protein F